MSTLELDADMLADLIQESREHLENIEPDLMEMEKSENSVSDDLINRIFRAIHSIKGAFGFFNITPVVTLSHQMENVLSRVRERELIISRPLVDQLFCGIDKLKEMFDNIHACEKVNIEETILKLHPYTKEGELPSTLEKKDEVKHLDCDKISPNDVAKYLDDDLIASIKKEGQKLYLIDISDVGPEELKQWDDLGEVLNLTSYKEQILYRTVLESDLICHALEISSGLIIEISLAKDEGKQKESIKKDVAIEEDTSKKPIKSKDDTIRVKVPLLDSLISRAGELVLARNQLLQLSDSSLNSFPQITSIKNSIISELFKLMKDLNIDLSEMQTQEYLKQWEKQIDKEFDIPCTMLQGYSTMIHTVDTITSNLQEGVMQTRMQPISVLFNKFPRIIRDLAHRLDKIIELQLIGEDVELDRSLIELLSDPLVHLIRNSADHGIEKPAKRVECGKSEKGLVILKAFHESGKVRIEIEDNGAGIDPQKVKDKAISKGVISQMEAESLSDEELQMLIFSPGFSTAEELSDVSGRGVGMDVVKTNIEKLGGSIDLYSIPGNGTHITIKLPLTLAIIPSLIVKTSQRYFAVPQMSLREIVRLREEERASRIEKINDAEMLRLRGELIPLLRLSTVLGLPQLYIDPETKEIMSDKRLRIADRRSEDGRDYPIDQRQPIERRKKSDSIKILILAIDENCYGLLIDEIVDCEEIVVKAIPEFLKESRCYGGTTIMGDGHAAMILDPRGVAELGNLHSELFEKQNIKDRATDKNLVDKKEVLLLTTEDGEKIAIEIENVERVEKRDKTELKRLGSMNYITQGEESMQIVPLNSYLPISQNIHNEQIFYIIVPKGASKKIGFSAWGNIDTASISMNFHKSEEPHEGIKGSEIIEDTLTIIADMPALTQLALKEEAPV